jgi:predicted RNA-binding protein YlxR (DUF448 family)
MSKPIADLVRIASNGGGMILDASIPTADLIRIASNAAGKGTIIIRNADSKPTAELVRIASNGNGSVIFEF